MVFEIHMKNKWTISSLLYYYMICQCMTVAVTLYCKWIIENIFRGQAKTISQKRHTAPGHEKYKQGTTKARYTEKGFAITKPNRT